MDLRLNELTWDLAMGDTDLQLADGAEAVRQHLSQRLKTFLAEWFLDMRVGLPWRQQIMVKNPDPVVLDSVFKAEIVNTPRISELLSFDLAIDAGSRTLQLSFAAVGDDGSVISFDEVLS